MTLYNVYYVDQDESKLFGHMRYQATTDNFEKWLKDYNSNREKDFQESADNFEVEEIGLYLYDKENV
tara:strand:+ start:92 stop:292 length:201 start_codon:yes stop_codon:yes gene_type:complete